MGGALRKLRHRRQPNLDLWCVGIGVCSRLGTCEGVNTQVAFPGDVGIQWCPRRVSSGLCPKKKRSQARWQSSHNMWRSSNIGGAPNRHCAPSSETVPARRGWGGWNNLACVVRYWPNTRDHSAVSESGSDVSQGGCATPLYTQGNESRLNAASPSRCYVSGEQVPIVESQWVTPSRGCQIGHSPHEKYGGSCA